MATESLSSEQHGKGAHRKAAVETGGRRLDLQGMRTVAVLLVVANHLFGQPRGGFVGVDVFFVISGYLITGLLVREAEKNGRLSVRDFYARRARRIVPLAGLVLLTTTLLAQKVLTATPARQTRVDSVWAALFGANINMSRQGTDYFQQGRAPSAVQHYWSLAVEEQFYVLWPLLIIVAFAVAAKVGGRGRTNTLALAAVGSSASLLYCIHLTGIDQTAAYFSTPARAWELGLGALVGLSQARLARAPLGLRATAAWGGLALIAFSAVTYTEATPFPGSAALLPVLGAGMVLAADDPAWGPGAAGLLKNRITTYLGDISFSIYLWHFPCIVLASASFAHKGLGYYAVAAALPFALSSASYHLIEDPIRQSSWLAAKPPHHRRRTPSGWARDNRRTLDGLLAMGGVVVVASAALLLTVEPVTGAGGQYALAAGVESTAAGAGVGPTKTVADLQRQIQAALLLTRYPVLAPSIDAVTASGKQAPDDVRTCTSPGATVTPCVWSSGRIRHRAVLLGDSMAMTYTVPLRRAVLAAPGWALTDMAQWGCSFSEVADPRGDPRAAAGCPATKARALDYIRSNRPDVVFIANAYVPRSQDEKAFAAGVDALIRPVLGSLGRVVILAAPPVDKNIGTCYRRGGQPSACISSLTRSWSAHDRSERQTAADLGGVYVDTTPLFCAAERCPAFVGSTVVKVDIAHMTPAYQREIAVPFAEVLADAGVTFTS